jgi:hypothetical protein
MSTDIKLLLAKLSLEGGCLVSSADCSEIEIVDARQRGDFYVQDGGLGFVRRLPDWMQKHSRFHRGAEPGNCEVTPR